MTTTKTREILDGLVRDGKFQSWTEEPWTCENLTIQIGEDSYQCAACGAVDQFEDDAWESYGGTSEGYIRCLACGTSAGWADLSAVM